MNNDSAMAEARALPDAGDRTRRGWRLHEWTGVRLKVQRILRLYAVATPVEACADTKFIRAAKFHPRGSCGLP
jgi:hypothetical protein